MSGQVSEDGRRFATAWQMIQEFKSLEQRVDRIERHLSLDKLPSPKWGNWGYTECPDCATRQPCGNAACPVMMKVTS